MTPDFAHYQEQYQGLLMQPLRIIAHLVNPVVFYDPPHLDSILAAAIVEESLGGNTTSVIQYPVPLPLKLLWRDTRGLPLWASTNFDGERLVEDEQYMHKRAIDTRMTNRNITTVNGIHKEMRRPLPTAQYQMLSSDCIGNADEIARLLKKISGIGKKRAYGMGAVKEWQIEPIEKMHLTHDRKPLRPLPAGFARGAWAYVSGWTPPYHYVPWHSMILRVIDRELIYDD